MERFRETTRVLWNADLAGFTRMAATLEPLALAAFLDAYYTRAAAAVEQRGGRVVKLMGDGCFAVFPEERCAEAVDAALALAGDAGPLPAGVAVGVNVHLGTVAEGEVGAGEGRRYDVFGAEVNNLFRMGGGPGVRITGPVLARLPAEARARWRGQDRPVTYTLTSG